MCILDKTIWCLCGRSSVSLIWTLRPRPGAPRRLLERLSREGRVVDLCDDLPKSAVLCTGGLGEILYISQISSRTLQKRVEEGKL